ncbi:hypothetical protein LTS07_007578 [Exophiala sideris]|uniref:Uncharacterized protein n=1 Tax=Exophiala sideris TaxID=1016849 RepID=A0ABR0JAI9_9EURO|nr:hypothetical protein LTS07_007578 [Exophiala sideris]KAK5032308.1 hypothetical protein LTR13_007131 [Exophiala sideris]KAK5059463.1 hypothetical protein LTR69_006052 [Exophiala sideris]KAK5186626.1 hypothetical protein LTR44_000632 [Eurotiomycetes sp. CCFEE 6388]
MSTFSIAWYGCCGGSDDLPSYEPHEADVLGDVFNTARGGNHANTGGLAEIRSRAQAESNQGDSPEISHRHTARSNFLKLEEAFATLSRGSPNMRTFSNPPDRRPSPGGLSGVTYDAGEDISAKQAPKLSKNSMQSASIDLKYEDNLYLYGTTKGPDTFKREEPEPVTPTASKVPSPVAASPSTTIPMQNFLLTQSFFLWQMIFLWRLGRTRSEVAEESATHSLWRTENQSSL